jgi:act minimal PKS acyl carrier protein
MADLTLDRLRDIMRKFGEDETVDLTGDIMDRPLTALGYDSLALLQILAVVGQQTGVRLPEDILADLPTPRTLMALVNAGAVNA